SLPRRSVRFQLGPVESGCSMPIFLDGRFHSADGVLCALIPARQKDRHFVVVTQPGLREVWATNEELPLPPFLVEEVDLWMEQAIRVQQKPDIRMFQEPLDELWVGLVEVRTDNHPLNLLGILPQKVERLETDRSPGDGDLTEGTCPKE